MTAPPPAPTLAVTDACHPGSAAPRMDAHTASDLASVLKVLADPVRLRLLDHIASAPGTTVCACHLPGPLGISQPTLSHHLKRLVDAGLVTRERHGRWLHYTADRARLATLVEALSWPDPTDACC